MSYNFSGKVVLVTGSSSGIGKDIVTSFARLGASVVVTGRNETRVKEVSDEVRKVSTATDSIKVISVVADLEKDDDIKTLIETTVKSFGHLDILVNNAGFGMSATVFDDDFISVFQTVFATNVLGVLKVTKEAVPHLLKSKAANIINISSVASTKPRPGGTPYCTSKAALDMITKCLCDELSPKGVRVNSIKYEFVLQSYSDTKFTTSFQSSYDRDTVL